MKIYDYNEALPHKVSMVICLKCYERWISCRPEITKLIDLECENCGPGYVIETGEIIKENYTMLTNI